MKPNNNCFTSFTCETESKTDNEIQKEELSLDNGEGLSWFVIGD